MELNYSQEKAKKRSLMFSFKSKLRVFVIVRFGTEHIC